MRARSIGLAAALGAAATGLFGAGCDLALGVGDLHDRVDASVSGPEEGGAGDATSSASQDAAPGSSAAGDGARGEGAAGDGASGATRDGAPGSSEAGGGNEAGRDAGPEAAGSSDGGGGNPDGADGADTGGGGQCTPCVLDQSSLDTCCLN